MITQAIRVPTVREARGDLFEVAKPLLLLGWSESAAVTARVALERALRCHVSAIGIDTNDRSLMGIGRLTHLLREAGVISRHLHADTVDLNICLSDVAHGRAVSLSQSVELVTRTQRRLSEIAKCARRRRAD